MAEPTTSPEVEAARWLAGKERALVDPLFSIGRGIADWAAQKRKEAVQATRDQDHATAVTGAMDAHSKNAAGKGADPAPITPLSSHAGRETPDAATVAQTMEPPDSGRLRFVRQKSGQLTGMTPEEASAAVRAGGSYMTEEQYREGMAAKRQQHEAKTGNFASNIFETRGAPPRWSTADARPYSEKMGELLAEAPVPDLDRETQLVRLEKTPWGTTHERESIPSGIEQAASPHSYRRHLEDVQDVERTREVAEAKQAAEQAIAERTQEEAKIDPLAVAKIQAWARLCPEQLKGEYAEAQTMRAFQALRQWEPQIAAMHAAAAQAAALAGQEKDPAKAKVLAGHAAELKATAERYQKWAELEANLMSGGHIAQFRQDLLTMLAGSGLLGGAAAGTTAPGGGT